MRRFFLYGLTALFVIGAIFYFYCQSQQQQAVFNIYALGHYIAAYEMVEGKAIQSLSELPDVQLVDYEHSLKFYSGQIRQRVSYGYYYDFQRVGDRQFFIVASPTRLRAFNKQFAMLEDMNVRVNIDAVGNGPHSYENIQTWPVLGVQYHLRTVNH